jgi:hypothetical protein
MELLNLFTLIWEARNENLICFIMSYSPIVAAVGVTALHLSDRVTDVPLEHHMDEFRAAVAAHGKEVEAWKEAARLNEGVR